MLLDLSVSPVEANPVVSKAVSPPQHMAQGWQAFQRGDFAQAVSSWTEAAYLYERAGEQAAQSDALTKLSHAYQALGHYRKALQSLRAALELAEHAGDQTHFASVLGSLGNAYIAIGPTDEAELYLREGLRLAREAQNTALVAVILNNLGNLLVSQKKHKDAMTAYEESTKLALTTANFSLAMSARINTATILMRNQQYEQSKASLDRVLGQMRSVEPSHHKVYSLLNVGLVYHELHPHLPAFQDALLLRAYQTFNEALQVAQALGDPRASSYALGYMGELYEETRQYQEALQLTRRAVLAAQQVNAPESLYRWQWQTGRLLKALGNHDDAIAAYRRAVETLRSIRHEMFVGFGALPSFRETIGPVYFELVDLLLQRAALLREREQYEPYLAETREVVERFKVAELQDYFRDECVEAARSRVTRLDVVSQTAIVVYPIILPDRLELLVSLPAGLERFTVPVDANTLTQEVRHFRRKLVKRTTREYLPHAQQLYDWLIRPLEPVLAPLTIEALVFVPDGPLRTIPLAALHDGQAFLIRKYALATTPGLDLTDPRPLKREKTKALVVGLTESVQGFPALPNVAVELQAIKDFYGGEVILNEQFSVSNVEEKLQQAQFTIVHIASHGQFDRDLEKTFILTFNDKLTLDRLDQFVGFFRFRDDPLELLTLSACQTAVGDDRAALGLAGIAIKAGARSALATLWFINDQASSELVIEFYRQLQDPSISRAMALQRAQVKLLDDQRYQHPGYWSPFLLLNNWL
jgi:CHAT domain-containing protein/Tfp pilus assembly protein PilF